MLFYNQLSINDRIDFKAGQYWYYRLYIKDFINLKCHNKVNYLECYKYFADCSIY